MVHLPEVTRVRLSTARIVIVVGRVDFSLGCCPDGDEWVHYSEGGLDSPLCRDGLWLVIDERACGAYT